MVELEVMNIFRKYFNVFMEMKDLKENPEKEPNKDILDLFDEGAIGVSFGTTKLGIIIIIQNIIMVLGEETIHITDPGIVAFTAVDHKITDPLLLKTYQNLKKEITL